MSRVGRAWQNVWHAIWNELRLMHVTSGALYWSAYVMLQSARPEDEMDRRRKATGCK